MKILLTHGYFIADDLREQEIMRPYPPLGLLYISGFLSKNGIANEVLDTTFMSRETFKAHVLGAKPRIISFYVNLMTRPVILELIAWIRTQTQAPELQKAQIIIGGPEGRFHAENFLKNGANVVVVGEGEETMLELAQTLGAPMNPFLNQVKSIIFINGHGEVTATEERPQIRDVDSLIPDRNAIDLSPYIKVWKERHGRSMLNINSMRGCPFTCRWCSRAVYGQSYRRRSPECVVAEMQAIQQQYLPDALWFVDDVFTISQKWMEAFADEILAVGLDLPYECISRADRLNDEVIALLKQSGCFRLWIGAESGSQKILNAMDRKVTAVETRLMIYKARAAGIETGTFIMLGYPGETIEDIEETVEHLVACDPEYFTLTIAYPITGTELHNEVQAIMTDELDWLTTNDRQQDFERTYPRAFYGYAVSWVTHIVKFRQLKKHRKELSKAGLGHWVKAKAARARMDWILGKVSSPGTQQKKQPKESH